MKNCISNMEHISLKEYYYMENLGQVKLCWLRLWLMSLGLSFIIKLGVNLKVSIEDKEVII
jgi:hypothetical protein